MADTRKRHSGGFKAQAAVAAIWGERGVLELSSEYGVHPSLIAKWKKRVLAGLPRIFSGRADPADESREGIGYAAHYKLAGFAVCLIVYY
jgi:transposase-like protein